MLSTVLGIFQFRKGAYFGYGPTVMVDDASRVRGHPVAHNCSCPTLAILHTRSQVKNVNMRTQLWAKKGLQGLTEEV